MTHGSVVRRLVVIVLVLATLLPAATLAFAAGGGGRGGGGSRSGNWQGRGGGHGHRHHGHFHGRHGTVFLGGSFWWGPWWAGPSWWGPPFPPQVVITEPPVFIQRGTGAESGAGFWHYCASAQGYYPHVQSCPEAWILVAPRSQ